MAHDSLVPLWDALLRCQTAMTLPLELPYLYTSAAWRNTPSVLDLGTGIGCYLSGLARRFATKAYLGVDTNVDYIGLARSRAFHDGGGANLSFEVRDLFEVTDTYPFVIARLVAQHLPSLDRFAAHVARLLDPGGVFLSVEPNDHMRAYWPEMPGLTSLFRDYGTDRKTVGHERDAGLLLPEMARRHGMSVDREIDIVIPSTVGSHRDLFVEFHQLIFEIFEKDFGIGADYEALRDELRRWGAMPDAFAQVGIRMTFYGRA
jgi:SAM-dependent methyltransferase